MYRNAVSRRGACRGCVTCRYVKVATFHVCPCTLENLRPIRVCKCPSGDLDPCYSLSAHVFRPNNHFSIVELGVVVLNTLDFWRVSKGWEKGHYSAVRRTPFLKGVFGDLPNKCCLYQCFFLRDTILGLRYICTSRIKPDIGKNETRYV